MEPAEQARRNEEARRAVLDYLAVRHPLAQSPETIHRRVNGEGHNFSMRELESALAFLSQADLVARVPSKFGSSYHYQATSEGVLAYERAD